MATKSLRPRRRLCPASPSSNPIQNGQTFTTAPPADRPFFLSEKFVWPFDRFRVPTHTALLHVILILVVAPPLPMPPSPPPPPPLSVPTAVAAAETPPWRAMPDPSHRRRYSLCAIESNRRNEKCWMRRSRWPWRNCWPSWVRRSWRSRGWRRWRGMCEWKRRMRLGIWDGIGSLENRWWCVYLEHSFLKHIERVIAVFFN